MIEGTARDANVATRPMTKDEYDAWRLDTVRGYADEQVTAGNWNHDEAMERSLAETDRLLPAGISTPGMLLLRAVLEDTTPVGRMSACTGTQRVRSKRASHLAVRRSGIHGHHPADAQASRPVSSVDMLNHSRTDDLPAVPAGVDHLQVDQPSTARSVRLKPEFRRQGQMANVLDRHQVGTLPATMPTPTSEVRTWRGDAIQGGLDGEIHLGDASDFTLRLTRPDGGRQVEDLQPYLGAADHVVVTANDGSTVDHAHAETFDDRGRPLLALPGTVFGPELDLHLRFELPGTYRLFAKFRLGDRTVFTAPFVVHTR